MIVIPMAGLSRRFTEAGYAKPKYMLPLPGGTVFAHAVASFRSYFQSERFLFIARPVEETEAFVRAECAALGVKFLQIHMLNHMTAGQAETVEFGLKAEPCVSSEPVTIFNIDTFRPDFRFPEEPWWSTSHGYLEVFNGSGANWSYVSPGPDGSDLVIETAEKQPISDLCCTGLYHFARAADFHQALATERLEPSSTELYVAPLYNHLIRIGRKIHYHLIDRSQVIFCGVPIEYEKLL